ncbi:MAG TPA: oxygenase MpaB family protein [Solirubrobacteraceae bacterium]|nr:oxygenase MpaB family protein [Solirubrobacteraceae bacterium]
MFADTDGYFPRGRSVLRQVQEEHLVGLFYGQRALCVGALAPLNYVGTSEHTNAKLTPFKRLVHTGNAFEKIFFGSRAEADRVLGFVAKMHDRVKGVLAEDAGPVAAGTPYSAYDPELMLWTVAVMADSAQCFYELFVRRLSDAEREWLWQDYVRFAELFGMPRSVAPGSYPEFRAWYRSELASDRMFLTDEARYVGYATAFEIPLPRRSQPGKRVHDAVMLGSLPARVRSIYGLPYGRREQAAFRAGVVLMRSARRMLPPPLARGYNTRSFELVAKTERRRVARGEPTPQILANGPAGPGIEVLQRAA